MKQKALLSALSVLMGTSMAWAGTTPSLHDNPVYGTVLASSFWDMETKGPEYGLYSFDGETFNPIVTDSYLAAMGGGTYVNGTYCYNYNFSFMGSMAQNLYLIYDFEKDVITGWQLYETTYADVATQVAYDATSGKVYGQFYNRDRSARVWGTRDIEYGETSPIRPMVSRDLYALAFDNLGRAWAVDAAGDLLQIDKLTGTYTVVGNTGLELAQTTQQSGAIDPVTGLFYMFAVCGGENAVSALYTIDLATAQASKVAELPGNEQVTGAYFMPLTYAAAAPAAPEQMKLNFERESLLGTVSCVAPAETEGGSVLVEGAKLTLTLNGEKVGEVQTAPGQTVSFDVQVPTTGTHVFQLIASNASGNGRPSTVHQWIGLDVPEAVTDLLCRNTDNTHALLTWTAPTTGVHGGYLDPSHLRYSVIDSDGTTVATDLTETSCEVSKSGSRLTVRTYTVVAFTDSEEGLSATSNRIYFGNRYKVPYSTYFDTQAEFDLWDVWDVNDDGSTWTYESYNRYVHYTYNKYNAADDWLFSAPIHLKAEQYYDLNSNVAAEMTYYRERFEIMVCSAQHPDSVVAIVRTPTETDKDGKEERRFYLFEDCFCVPVEGDYYLAYHCISDADQLRFEVHSIDLNMGASFDAPAAADNAVFRPGNFGGSSASVEFDAPTKSIRGNALTSLTKAELYNGSNLCATLTDIEPGLHYTLTDGSAPRGYNNYRLIIYNEKGKGLPVSGTVYVGPDTPIAPQNVKIWLDGNEVNMSWDPVSTGAHGGYIDPNQVTYAVVRQQDVELVYSGTATSCKDNSLPNTGVQTTYFYGIFAYYGSTPGQGSPTSDVILGTPYSMPFHETFSANSSSSTLWLIGYDPYNTVGTNWTVGSEPSFDNKPGNLTLTAYYDEGGYHFLSSGKVHIDGSAQHPVLTFAYMGAGEADRIEVEISTQGVPNSGHRVAAFSPTEPGEWDTALVDLTEYKNQNVIITWHCYLAEAGDMVLDDVFVYDDHGTGVESVEAGNSEYIYNNVYDMQGRRTQPGKAEGFVITPSAKRLILNKK
ncbi:MAG: fibronectin type III domain-containing protein [Bacteroidales bacterium]|nr:fibronectin type III domain-containing protein [Candidatus Liminaster caballi]